MISAGHSLVCSPSWDRSTVRVVDEAAARRRLFDAVARALTVSNQPVLLVVDDAQWSDDASVELIRHVVRQPFDVAVVVVLTARFEEVDPAHPLVALRDELVALDRLTELRLERLPAAATVELGSALMGAALGREPAKRCSPSRTATRWWSPRWCAPGGTGQVRLPSARGCER